MIAVNIGGEISSAHIGTVLSQRYLRCCVCLPMEREEVAGVSLLWLLLE